MPTEGCSSAALTEKMSSDECGVSKVLRSIHNISLGASRWSQTTCSQLCSQLPNLVRLPVTADFKFRTERVYGLVRLAENAQGLGLRHVATKFLG